MIADALTDEQRCFANHPGEAFVEACPGSGKTRTVVERFGRITQRLPPRRAVAVLSYTNAAVEEFAKSCRKAELISFLQFPNFIGTFDAFVRHFIVLPPGIEGGSIRPIIVDSWDRFDVEIRFRGTLAYRKGVSLDKFAPATNTIDPSRIGDGALRSHVVTHQLLYEQEAAAKRRFLHRNGYLSAGDARLIARDRIHNQPWGMALGRALGARFQEIIVDEAQDCNPLDLEILAWLRENHIPVTIVCDPDQAIYEFRDGTPSHLRAFGSNYRNGDRKSLSGNFRSSPSICLLASTLRGNRHVDISVGETATVTNPVMLLTYSGRSVPSQIGDHFLDQLRSVSVPPAEAIILAHALKAAQRATGDPLQRPSSGNSRVETVARAIGEFWSPSATGRSREAAFTSVEKLLLNLMGLWGTEDRHPGRVVERAGLNRRVLRRQALHLVTCLPKTCNQSADARKVWVESLRQTVKKLGLVVPKDQSIAVFFPHPKNGEWLGHLDPPAVASIACSTVHEAKGREYEAVCVVLQPDRAPDNYTSRLLASWESRTDDESKRVLYVAVTRAKKFVMLAVPEVFGDRCVAILDSGKVPHARFDIKNASAPRRQTARLGGGNVNVEVGD